MIKPKHHIVIYPLFKALTRFLLKHNFKSIQIKGRLQDNGKSMLIIANHISWWDGFWIMHLNLKLFHRKFYFMMLEKQLKKHWYFRYSGGYSIKKTPKSITDSLYFTTELLKHNKNMVFWFPQGKIHSIYNDTIKFEKGIQKIIDAANNDTQVVFVANLLDYFCDSKPHVYIHIKQYIAKELKRKSVEEQYNLFYTNVLNKQKVKSI